MPIGRKDALHIDERTAELGRQLFSDVRQEQQALDAERKRHTAGAQGGSADGAGFWDWLTGDGDANGDSGD